MDRISVRRLRRGELSSVCRMPHRPCALHRARLAEQESGALVYLFAWLDGSPAGHLIVSWPDGRRASEFALRYWCAEIGDVYVDPMHRRRGIGRRLMNAAEAEIRERGFARIGLATGLDDDYGPARAMYASLGYRDAGAGTFIETWLTYDDAGNRRPGGEVLTYLVKGLTGPRDRDGDGA